MRARKMAPRGCAPGRPCQCGRCPPTLAELGAHLQRPGVHVDLHPRGPVLRWDLSSVPVDTAALTQRRAGATTRPTGCALGHARHRLERCSSCGGVHCTGPGHRPHRCADTGDAEERDLAARLAMAESRP